MPQKKKRDTDSKFYISDTNKVIVILQTSQYSSAFCWLLVKKFPIKLIKSAGGVAFQKYVVQFLFDMSNK